MAQVTPPTGKQYTDMFDYNSLNDENILYAENESIKLGVNLALGGAITYLAAQGGKNLINSYDWGRQVQQEEGIGVGLYLAREILQRENGYIKVESKLGEGSSFGIFPSK